MKLMITMYFVRRSALSSTLNTESKGHGHMKKTTEQSLNSAFESAKMEGFEITPSVEANCIKIVSGELSIADYIQCVIQSGTANVSAENR